MASSDCPQPNQKTSVGRESVSYHIPYNFTEHFVDESYADECK
jgi:hypothetical protein